MAVTAPLPADLSRFLETVWQIKKEKAEAARERMVREEMDRYRERDAYRPPDIHGCPLGGTGVIGLTTEYAEVQ